MKSYLVKQKDLESRMKSRSGATFAAVSDLVLEQGGSVYGAGFGKDFTAVHKRVVTKEDRDELRGSKYVQSSMADCFRQVEGDLREGRCVLFSGTPCQVAGLKAFLSAKLGSEADWRESLLLMDIVCHGVPSPKVWQDYLSYMEKKHRGKVTGVDFRNKKNHGWWAHIETIMIEHKPKDSQMFEKLFYEHNILRDCCYECPYKSLNREGDLSLADAWGIAQANPEFDDNKGVSLVLCNTRQGEEWLAKIHPTCDMLEVSMEAYMQEPLQHSFVKPENYEAFWESYQRLPFAEFVKGKYEDDWKQLWKWKTKRLVKSVVPQSVINKLRGRS